MWTLYLTVLMWFWPFFDPLLEIKKQFFIINFQLFHLFFFKKCNIWMILLPLSAQYKMWALNSNESVSIYWWEGEKESTATGKNDEAVMERREEQTGSVSINLNLISDFWRQRQVHKWFLHPHVPQRIQFPKLWKLLLWCVHIFLNSKCLKHLFPIFAR